MLSELLLLAEDKAPAPEGGGDIMRILLPLLPILFLGYFLLIRPMRKQEQQRQQLVNALKKNDKVITNSGMYGTVVAISETEDEVTIKVDDNVRIKMVKGAIARNVTQEEALKDPKSTTAEGQKS